MAQVIGYKLSITVVLEDADAKEKYLKGRPSFAKFFNVDDELVDDVMVPCHSTLLRLAMLRMTFQKYC